MKIIKTILLLAITTFAGTAIYAQQSPEVKAEIAKRAESTVPAAGSKPALAHDTKPNPDLSRSGKPQQQPELKESTERAATADAKDEEIKPKLAPSQNLVTTPVIKAETRQSAVNREPVIPAQNSNMAPTPAVKTAAKPVAVQQQQN